MAQTPDTHKGRTSWSREQVEASSFGPRHVFGGSDTALVPRPEIPDGSRWRAEHQRLAPRQLVDQPDSNNINTMHTAICRQSAAVLCRQHMCGQPNSQDMRPIAIDLRDCDTSLAVDRGLGPCWFHLAVSPSRKASPGLACKKKMMRVNEHVRYKHLFSLTTR